MDKPIYDLVDLTPEEVEEFKKSFQELLDSRSLYYEPVPAYTRETIMDPWKLTCQILLKKKVPHSNESTEKAA